MHVDVDGFPDPAEVAANIARLGALGLKVQITEMDVRCTPPCGADRLALQARIYGDVFEACLNNTNCEGVVTWGVTDLYSWQVRGGVQRGAARRGEWGAATAPARPCLAAFAGSRRHPLACARATSDSLLSSSASRCRHLQWDFDNPTHENMAPLLFDLQYGRKPAYYEVLAVLQMAAERRAASSAAAIGRAVGARAAP